MTGTRTLPPDDTEGPLVILGPHTRSADAARRLGCPVAYVEMPDDSRVEAVEEAPTCYSVDYTTPEFLTFVSTTLEQIKPRAVVSLTEAGLWPAALAAELLGLPGTSPQVVAALCDKVLMRSCMLRAGAADLSVRFAELSDGEEAAQLMSSWPGLAGAILKPRSGTASTGVEMIHNAGQLADRGSLTGAILEEYIPGTEYSAETFTVDGAHRLIAIAEKWVDPGSFVELGHVVPPPDLNDGDIAAVASAVSRFLDAVGLRNGPAHTEFKMNDGSIKIIESHNRVGGGEISTLTQLVTGVDLVLASLGWPIGRGLPPGQRAPGAAAAAIAFATAPTGIVRSVALPTEALPGIRVEDVSCFVNPGDPVRRLASSRNRVGHVVVTGPTAEAAMAAAEQLAARIDVRTVSVGFGDEDG